MLTLQIASSIAKDLTSMKRSALALAAAAVTAVGSIGVTAPAASAAAAGPAHTVAAAQVAAKPAGTKAPLAVDKRKVLSLIAHKDAALARAAMKIARAGLSLEMADAVASNVSRDRLALAQLEITLEAAGTAAEVRALGAQVHQARPSVYSSVIDGLRDTARFDGLVAANAAAVGALTAQVDAKALEGYDVASVVDILTAATVANDAAAVSSATATQKGMALTAFSTSEELAAFSADLSAAAGLLDSVDQQLLAANDALAAMVPAEDPALETPIVESPAVETPLG